MPDAMRRASKVGQLAAWRQLSRIEQHCKIEMTLDSILSKLGATERWTMN